MHAKKKKKKSQASGGIQPQSHLVVYHVQTLNVAALKTKQDDWLVNREKNSMASILDQHLNTMSLNWCIDFFFLACCFLTEEYERRCRDFHKDNTWGQKVDCGSKLDSSVSVVICI